MEHSHSLLEFYWNIRRREYLNELDEHHTIGKEKNNVVKLGGIVLACDHA